MHFGFLIIGIITCYIWTYKCTGAIPTVTLTASSSPYFDIGGSISLTCSISEDVGINNVYLTKVDTIKGTENYVYIIINNASSCVSYKWQPSVDPHSYSITCEQWMTVHIVMNGTVASDNNTVWGCQMSAESGICHTNSQSCTSTSSVTIVQRVPVSSVQLTDGTGQLLVTPVPVLDGSNKVFRCDTSPNGSRPRALFNWYKMSENQSPILIQGQSVSTPTPKPEVDLSMTISYSTLTLMGSRSYQNMYIYCEARDETNRGNFSRSTEVQLNIVYGPGSSIYLTPNSSAYQVDEGQKAVDIICNATCNPACSYRWIKGNVQINSSNTLSLGIVQKNVTGNYTCEAFNTIRGQRNGSNISVEVFVRYAPVVKLQAAVRDVNPYRVKQGRENMVLVCEVVAAYPPSTSFVWTQNGNLIQGESRSSFSIHVATRETNGIWGCKGLNGVGTPLESQLQVDVQYGPVIEPIGNKTVLEGQLFSVACNIDSNPLPVSVSWTKDNNAMFSSPTAILTIHNVSRYDRGTYRCTAVNIIHPSGENKESLNGMEWFYLNVQYGAEIINVSVTEGSTVNENTTATLRCLVDSNPESNITWTKQGIMGVLQTNLSVHESQLIIEHAECLDTSNYTCNARNSVGQPVDRKVPLYVTCHPRTDFRSPPVTTVYSKRYGNASLNYTVISFPEPIFNWSFIGNGSESRSLPDSATKYDSGLQSILIFTNLSIKDFGFYKVLANNTLPTSATEVFQLIPADVPDIPSNVTVSDLKQTSLTVQWVAGYDGGLKQTFHIMIKDNEITRSVYASDPGFGKLGTRTIEDLIPNTEYSISMSANNSLGSSSVTNVIILITLKVPDTSPSQISAIAGGVAGAVVALLLVGISIILWRRYQHKKKNVDEDDLNNDFRHSESNENGLKDNPVYDSSDVRPGPLAEYTTVDKSKKEAFHKEGPTNLYAQVDKTTKGGQKNAVKGKHGKNSKGDMYENATLFGRSSNKENVYENPEAETSSENVYENPGAAASTGTLVRTNGLLYADLMLDPPTTKNGKPVVRGLENQTEYAEIAYGKRGEPLPDNEETEHGSSNK